MIVVPVSIPALDDLERALRMYCIDFGEVKWRALAAHVLLLMRGAQVYALEQAASQISDDIPRAFTSDVKNERCEVVKYLLLLAREIAEGKG